MFTINRGTNISHWLSQSKDRGKARKTKFTETDVKRIADWGMDHIRIPIDEEQMWKEDESREEEAFALLEAGIQWAESAGLRVIVDLHIMRSHYFNDAGQPPLFSDIGEQEKFARLWRDLSSFLSKYPNDLLAYELLNEAVADDPEDWNKVYLYPYKAIREREAERTILLGSNWFNQFQTFLFLKIPDDGNIILTFHYYNPMFITHWKAPWWRQGAFYQGPIQYPDFPIPDHEEAVRKEIVEHQAVFDNRYFDRSVMKSDISIPFNVARAHNLPLHCGEFGCRNIVSDDIRKGWYTDLVETFEEFGIAWSNWDYRGDFGLIDGKGKETMALKSLMKNY